MGSRQWELCPKCEGDSSSCRICKGTGLINSYSGRPPFRIKQVANPDGPIVGYTYSNTGSDHDVDKEKPSDCKCKKKNKYPSIH